MTPRRRLDAVDVRRAAVLSGLALSSRELEQFTDDLAAAYVPTSSSLIESCIACGAIAISFADTMVDALSLCFLSRVSLL